MSPESIQAMHRKAMELTDQAFHENAQRNAIGAAKLFREAYDVEAQAAKAAIELKLPEPTRSILLRSAATLALDSELPRDAEKLVALALAGDPPELIADELRNLYETVNLQRHLSLRGVKLEHHDFQVSLAGHAVGFGIALTREFLDRIENVCRLVRRTVERKLGKPFQEVGRPVKELSDDYGLFLSIPRGASFAVSLKVAQPSGQHTIPGVLIESDIIDEFMTGLAYVDSNDERALLNLITDDSYYRNFVSLARAIAPDGEEISMVGFTSSKRTVALRTKREAINIKTEPSQIAAPSQTPLVKISGRLLFADSRKAKRGQIRLIDSSGKQHPLLVPEGMMTDIVKPLWESYVEITAKPCGAEYQLLEISPMKKTAADGKP
jgi:hypothetical protein